MILAAPLVIPFAKAVGLSVGTLGMAALADQVNDYIQANPEESMKILSTIIPGAGIGQIFMSKEDKISLEDLDEMTDEEAQDLSKEQKAELMKQAGKRRDRELSIATSEKIGLSGPGKEKQDIEYEIDERYDEGGVEQKKAPFDYTKFFRKRRADGGAIGIEVLFREKKNLGGLLTGQAKSIYDSMMAAGYFTEDEIRNAIINAGYEIPGTTTTTTPVTNVAPNIINQGGGGDGPIGPTFTFDKNDLLGTSDYQGTGPGIVGGFKNAIGDLVGLYQKFSPIGIISNFMKQRAEKQQEIQNNAIDKARKEREMQQAIKDAEAAQAALDNAVRTGRRPSAPSGDGGVQDSGGPTGGYSYDAGGREGFGYGLKDGGLASMFVEKR